MNNFNGTGKIATAPRFNRTPTNKEYCKFIIEIPRGKSQDGKEQKDRINCACWGKAVESMKYIEFGDLVEFSGPLTTINYQKDGAWVNQWEINIQRIALILKNPEVNQAARPAPQPAQPQQYGNVPPVPPTPPAHCAPPPEDYQPFDFYPGGWT